MMMPKMRSVFTEPETSEDVCFSHGSNHTVNQFAREMRGYSRSSLSVSCPIRVKVKVNGMSDATHSHSR